MVILIFSYKFIFFKVLEVLIFEYINMIDLNTLGKKVKRYKTLNIFIWIVNLFLLTLSFIQFFINNYKLIVDRYFIILAILNIISFYLTYLIAERLNFFKYKYEYFKNL